MIKQNKLKIMLIVLLVILVGVGVYFAGFGKQNKGYSVVYLSTGEVYVGKLSTFPTMQLDNGYVLGTAKDVTDPTKSNFQLNPLNEALWAPKHLYLNKDQVIFYGPIEGASKIGEALKDK